MTIAFAVGVATHGGLIGCGEVSHGGSSFEAGAGGESASGDQGGEPEVAGTRSTKGGAASKGGATTGGVSPGGMTGVGGVAGTGGAAFAGATGRAGTGGGPGGSGAGGTFNSAGTGGGPAGCNPTPAPKSGDGMNTIIDPLDDTNIMFATAGVGMGFWDWGKDSAGMGSVTPAGSMTLMPVAGGYTGAALHLTGVGVTGWGAALSAFLNGPTSSFDASKYGGVAFFIKGATFVQEGMNKLMVLARMPDVLPGPGSCCSDSVPGQECYSAHRTIIDVPADWQEIKIRWESFKSPVWGLGSTIAFNPQRVRDINFGFNHDVTAKDQNPISFDVWIDNLRFLKADEPGNVSP